MPRDKDLKRLVRARMTKTGEAYTTARAQVTRKPRDTKPAPLTPAAPATTTGESSGRTTRARSSGRTGATPDYAALAGMSDDAIKAKTGCTWARWVGALDYHGAGKLSHGEIATLVREKFGIGDWWAQSVTVGYERIKGLRALGQRRDGSYEASKSRTFEVPVETLFAAWADARARRRWMDGATVRVRTANPPKTMRIEVGEGGIVAVGFAPKGPAKSAVAVQHTKLPDRETADRLKQWWAERLEALRELLAER